MIDPIIIARQREVYNVYDHLADNCSEADLARHIEEYRRTDTDFARAIVRHHEEVEKLMATEKKLIATDKANHEPN